MRFIGYSLVLIIGSLLFGLSGWTTLNAKEEQENLFHEDIFLEPRRPGVPFSHEMHLEYFIDTDCGVCHHSPEASTGKRVYIEDDEQGCKECHVFQKQGKRPSLRDAYHGSCTICHRRLIQSLNESAGPTTCGECHRKE